MSEPDRDSVADAPASTDFNALIASLRASGADRFDPVRLHYAEALAKRADAHGGEVRRVLSAKLLRELAAMQERLERARCDAREILDRGVRQYPHAAGELQQCFAAGDFKRLQNIIAALEGSQHRGSLAGLVRRLEQPSTGPSDTRPAENAGVRPELKTIREFRDTWSKLSVDKQVAQALGQAPKNAGPINSHMLVLRSLALMRDISPDYLNRFMSYADTLLCLDLVEKEKPAGAKKQATKATKK